MGGRGGITEKTVGESIVALGGNYFESGAITVPAGATVKKGVVLKRENDKFTPVLDMEPNVPVVVNPFDITNPGAAPADFAIRALIFGPVRADLLTINEAAISADQGDMLRNYGIIPVKVTDLSRTE
jgi:hypothetical protein